MKMKLTWNEKSTLTKTKDETQTPQSNTIDDLHFSFFSIDESEINAGIGVSIDPSHNFDQPMPDMASLTEEAALAEAAEVDDAVPTLESDTSEHQTDAPDTPAAKPEETSSGLIIHSDESIDSESSQPEPNNIVEKSAKLFAEARKAMDTIQIDPTVLEPKSVTPAQDSLYIEADVDTIMFPNEQFVDEYQAKSIPVIEKIVEVQRPIDANKITATHTQGTKPVNRLYRFLHNGVKEIISKIVTAIKIILVSIVLISIVSVFYVHYVDPSIPVTEIPMQSYTTVKELIIAIYKDILEFVNEVKSSKS
ncbi:hypothetical protein J27TS7_16000 [Paenibacillus dendritiformis]|uniref:hypothetical protein n=1 Tax=Paenibacillus dendritiformis TaxID=130049 RepID=UPI001B10611A|nr:hypothetical protein [Paenibacillus dendritiformis]GIO72086.1 hypothetical protein J27TS7_16000 [Paenibacillus dendritiformis]